MRGWQNPDKYSGQKNVRGEKKVVYLVVLQGPGVKRPAQKKLSNHTTKGPHVYGFTKRQSQNDLWSPVGQIIHTPVSPKQSAIEKT